MLPDLSACMELQILEATALFGSIPPPADPYEVDAAFSAAKDLWPTEP